MMENHAKRSNLMPFYSDFKQSLKRGYIDYGYIDLMPRKVPTNRFGEGLVVVVRYTVVVCLNPLLFVELS